MMRAMADLYRAIADPTRRAIIDELTDRDGRDPVRDLLPAGDEARLDPVRQAVSQHLEVLESAGLVTTRREGRCRFHSLDTEPLKEIVEQ